MNNKEILTKFYTSFSEGNSAGMISCYHENVVFDDPAFGKLKGERAIAMWQMLLSKKVESELNISFKIMNENQVEWIANYKYGPKKAPITNKVIGTFEFKDGLILKHSDNFSMWKWSQQALGLSGYLLGWSSLVKNKVQATTNKLLKKYMAN